jgi:hypothetical protein
VAGLVVALLLAGVASYYASSAPDGLNRVAEDQGIARTERDHAAADGPMAGYRARGIENDRLSGLVVASVVAVRPDLCYGARRALAARTLQVRPQAAPS